MSLLNELEKGNQIKTDLLCLPLKAWKTVLLTYRFVSLLIKCLPNLAFINIINYMLSHVVFIVFQKIFFWKMNCHDFSCHKNQHYHSPPNSPLCTTAQKMHHQTKHSRLVEYEQIWFVYGHWFIFLFFCHCQELRDFLLSHFIYNVDSQKWIVK